MSYQDKLCIQIIQNPDPWADQKIVVRIIKKENCTDFVKAIVCKEPKRPSQTRARAQELKRATSSKRSSRKHKNQPVEQRLKRPDYNRIGSGGPNCYCKEDLVPANKLSYYVCEDCLTAHRFTCDDSIFWDREDYYSRTYWCGASSVCIDCSVARKRTSEKSKTAPKS